LLELSVLQAVRLKGRVTVDVLAGCLGVPAADVEHVVGELTARGFLQGAPAVRITPDGRQHLLTLLGQERESIDHRALAAAYDEFDAVNSRLKAVVSSWQLSDAGTPNDHSDPAYDERVVARLSALHDEFLALARRIAAIAPRLDRYVVRFADAIDRVRAGDHTYIARPITDSYHTVWFEFHEELIGLLGRSRAEEAAAGRAL
jgi:pyruvate,orthophosphate dikinase